MNAIRVGFNQLDKKELEDVILKTENVELNGQNKYGYDVIKYKEGVIQNPKARFYIKARIHLGGPFNQTYCDSRGYEIPSKDTYHFVTDFSKFSLYEFLYNEDIKLKENYTLSEVLEMFETDSKDSIKNKLTKLNNLSNKQFNKLVKQYIKSNCFTKLVDELQTIANSIIKETNVPYVSFHLDPKAYIWS